jgi:triacylglycerol esterase/lipase EstA (alpha/beta hydrolase family)
MRRILFAATLAALLGSFVAFAAAVAAAAPPKVSWMRGVRAPGTPARYDRVGVLRIGPRTARNVLVLEPGTSAGSTYFAPLARWIVSRDPGWQIWAAERRENLLEDQSVLDQAKRGTASVARLYDYYLG